MVRENISDIFFSITAVDLVGLTAIVKIIKAIGFLCFAVVSLYVLECQLLWGFNLKKCASKLTTMSYKFCWVR